MTTLRHALRNVLLTAAYSHPAALGVAVRRGPRAARTYLTEIYRCSKSDAGLHLPVATIEAIAGAGTSEFSVVRPQAWGGSMTLTEISSICLLTAARKPRKILELGTFQGLTTLNLARNAPQATVHTLDLPAEAAAEETAFATNDSAIIARRGHYFYADLPEAARIRQHRGDSAKFDFLSAIGAGVDLCLIDAAHSYEYVRNDTVRILPLMAPGGLLLWHDYGRNDFLEEPEDSWGVSTFLHELRDLGVQVLQGTSLGVLVLSEGTIRALTARLAVRGS